MALSVAIQMDPIHSIDIGADSTFVLAMEAQARGHALYYYTPDRLRFRDGVLSAPVQSLTVRAERGNHADLGKARLADLSEMDAILLRQDPPFDMAYITTTHFLEHIHPSTLVVNDPAEVRNAPEKIYVNRYPDLMPPTLISSDPEAVREFRDEHGDIVVKPLYGNGGAGVFHLRPGDDNLGSLLEMYAEQFREPVIAQRYLPEIRQGDKRIILVDGEPAGAVSRMPNEGEARANFHAGGQAKKAELTDRERDICARIGPDLKARGLVFVGIDVIGDWLTEINVTSPTGIQETNRLSGTKIEARIWDAIEERLGGSG